MELQKHGSLFPFQLPSANNSLCIDYLSEKVSAKGLGWNIEYKSREVLEEIIFDLDKDKTRVVDGKYTIDINKNSKFAFLI